MEFFDAFLVVDGGNEHPAGVDAHHGPRRQIRDGDAGLADELFRLVVLVDTGKDDSVGAGAVIQHEFQKFFGLFNRFAGLDLHGAEVGLGDRLKVHKVLKQRLNFDLGEVDRLVLDLDLDRARRAADDTGFLRFFRLGNVQRLHRREYYPGIIITSHKFL